MSLTISSNVNAAIVSGQVGLARASDGLSQNASNIARLTARNEASSDPQQFLADAVNTQLGAIKQTLPSGGNNLTNELVGLSINSINAQASAKVIDTANDTIGTILDILA